MPESRERQVEFPPLQTHVKAFEIAMVVICVLCVVAVLIVVLGTNLGNPARP